MARLASAAAALALLAGLLVPPAHADLSPCNDRAAKPAAGGLAAPAPALPPDALRQGGDTVADAVPVASLPFTDSGATCGFTDDYDAVCPYSGSVAPDVVYVFTPPSDVAVTVDLCGSAYDTKVYILDQAGAVVACNDDYYADAPCGEYVSYIDHAELVGRLPYYIVIDGYGSECGDYALTVAEYEPCLLTCPPGGYLEGEPVIGDGYVDYHNGGCCGADGVDPIQALPGRPNGAQVLCGWSGWYTFEGMPVRDTDWFSVTAGPEGVIRVRADAQCPTYVFHLGPNDCATVGVLQSMMAGPCAESEMTLTVEPDSEVWLWTGPTTFEPPGGFDGPQYLYVLWLDGLRPQDVTGVPDTPSSAPASWSAVKGLFR